MSTAHGVPLRANQCGKTRPLRHSHLLHQSLNTFTHAHTHTHTHTLHSLHTHTHAHTHTHTHTHTVTQDPDERVILKIAIVQGSVLDAEHQLFGSTWDLCSCLADSIAERRQVVMDSAVADAVDLTSFAALFTERSEGEYTQDVIAKCGIQSGAFRRFVALDTSHEDPHRRNTVPKRPGACGAVRRDVMWCGVGRCVRGGAGRGGDSYTHTQTHTHTHTHTNTNTNTNTNTHTHTHSHTHTLTHTTRPGTQDTLIARWRSASNMGRRPLGVLRVRKHSRSRARSSSQVRATRLRSCYPSSRRCWD
jgi:hypothetical protein